MLIQAVPCINRPWRSDLRPLLTYARSSWLENMRQLWPEQCRVSWMELTPYLCRKMMVRKDLSKGSWDVWEVWDWLRICSRRVRYLIKWLRGRLHYWRTAKCEWQNRTVNGKFIYPDRRGKNIEMRKRSWSDTRSRSSIIYKTTATRWRENTRESVKGWRV